LALAFSRYWPPESAPIWIMRAKPTSLANGGDPMATEFCLKCHQPMVERVVGIRLPIFKARLFRYIQSHPGQSSIDLARR
jgi:hypothetical protein